ncbi:hypothetical protein G7Z17_g1006 [Cylindrodendrum hubeiense]|uniref:Uncharacterized protein n=1 Tax=Cylindrodendrum hubeiense TaxID=595255 RepID=A0A9P5LFR9_9HYPO|nr:hypothetical protein G7Z17_g1006 [Cylindrodendrum hubeiense]
MPVSIAPREPVPLDLARPSVAQLPDLVVRRILSFIYSLHPDDIRTVASLNTYLYQQARYVQHSHVHVNLDNCKHVLDRLYLIKRLNQLPGVRILQVSGREYNEGQQESNEILVHLAAMLPAMTGLRHLDWDVGWTGPGYGKGTTSVPVPAPILAALPTELRLHTSVFCTSTRESHFQARAFLHRLVGNESLCTLSVRITFIEEQDCLETMVALKKVLLSCPNLTKLPQIDVWYPRGGCEGYGPSIAGGVYCGLGLSDGERPPALEELGMRDYPWGIPGASQCQRYTGEGYEWDCWAEKFDWSRLVRLNDVAPPLASAIAPKLTHLRELVLENFSWIEADFIGEINSPLELISLTGWNRVNSKPDLINQFGTTLRQLRIHEPERGWKSKTHSSVTAPDLVHLSKSLPHLEHLALDIARYEYPQEWPYEVLDAIAAFPHLRTVELWFPLGTAPPAPTPLLTASSARHLFRHLREQNKSIQRVTLHSGAPLPRVSNVLGACFDLEPSWAMHNSVSFVCEMVYNGEGTQGEGGWLSVSCPEWSTDMNTKLCRLANQADRELADYKKLDADVLRLKVALDGPVDATEWEAWKDALYPRKTRQDTKEHTSSLRRFVKGSFKRAWKR